MQVGILYNLFETLNKNTKQSALSLKDLFGTIELEPVEGECVIECGKLIQNRGYYLAHSTIETISQIPIQLKIPCLQTLPIHEILAPKIRELKFLGMTNRDIALKLKINRKTVAKGLSYKT